MHGEDLQTENKVSRTFFFFFFNKLEKALNDQLKHTNTKAQVSVYIAIGCFENKIKYRYHTLVV